MLFYKYPCHVYMVRCSDGSLYTGITNDLEKRLAQHNGKKWGGAKYTSSRGPVELVYIEKYETRKEAAKREWEIKHTLSHQDKLQLISTVTKDDILKAI
ncbi:MAG TPA: GIY-YIG nuclease family protein [Candidatus Paceibacterota bacterium]|nr:GIY-YIG nuclease family protein [Candidatus Paceibacterota bacterium]